MTLACWLLREILGGRCHRRTWNWCDAASRLGARAIERGWRGFCIPTSCFTRRSPTSLARPSRVARRFWAFSTGGPRSGRRSAGKWTNTSMPAKDRVVTLHRVIAKGRSSGIELDRELGGVWNIQQGLSSASGSIWTEPKPSKPPGCESRNPPSPSAPRFRPSHPARPTLREWDGIPGSRAVRPQDW